MIFDGAMATGGGAAISLDVGWTRVGSAFPPAEVSIPQHHTIQFTISFLTENCQLYNPLILCESIFSFNFMLSRKKYPNAQNYDKML